MGNFEKLSVLVIVVIIVMILVVALYTWNSDGEEGAGEPLAANDSKFQPVKPSTEEWPIDLFEKEDGGTVDPAPPAPQIPGPGVVQPGVDRDVVAPGVVDPGVVDPGVVDPGVVDPGVVVDPDRGGSDRTGPGSGGSDVIDPSGPDAHQGGPWVYTVKGGDTISQICERELGTWRRQKEVFDLNPGLEPLSLRTGDKLKMPARGRASSLKVPAGSAAAPAHRAGGSIALGEWYVLQRGDRMSNIAKRAYGSIDRWPELWARNLSVVKDPDDVQPGTRIFIPK